MPDDKSRTYETLALSTKVEEDFVAPLTAVRGALEILRDFDELPADERLRFVTTALKGCAKLERAVEELASAVYATAQAKSAATGDKPTDEKRQQYLDRISLDKENWIAEVDYSGFVFTDSDVVNDFHDAVEEQVETSDHKWYFLVNYENCRVWPEAWIAFAHRGKRINVTFSLGTVRYDPNATTSAAEFDPDMFATREAALARIEEMRRGKGA